VVLRVAGSSLYGESPPPSSWAASNSAAQQSGLSSSSTSTLQAQLARTPTGTTPSSAASAAAAARMNANAQSNVWRDRYVLRFSGWQGMKFCLNERCVTEFVVQLQNRMRDCPHRWQRPLPMPTRPPRRRRPRLPRQDLVPPLILL
jgi:hypothetical protein